ncbi:MAG TPA: sensor histidine kinase KdpD [Gemmatimonadales bacterium]|nr:sensor histidine kinase KdpD [Gemmatimonadales bacterium]
MTEPRPSPEELLARIREEEARAGRGRLKIFFGANPGVGKTFAMLEEARARRLEGKDVVVGVVETHGRMETAALLTGLDLLPRHELTYKGVTLNEFDLDRALARKPGLILIDELAHTNAPGSRHEKRWQDVEELLAAGISVYSTLNVQHLESLNDVVAQITGVQVRETVPDSVFDAADEVELADLTPDDLLTRMQQGKVYLAEQAERAKDRFFRKGNLIALRELALRRVAERVDAQMRGYMVEHGIRETWPAGERLLVAVGSNPASARLVRAGRRIAERLHCEWVALHVETPGATPVSTEGRAALIDNLQLAEEFGARTVTVQGRDVAEEILAYARAQNVTRILIGKPTHGRWRDWFRGSLVDRLVRGSGEVDVYVITGEVEAGPRRRPKRIAARSPAREYWLALAVVLIATALSWLVFRRLSVTDVAMVYLLAAIVVSSRCGRGPSVATALLSIALFDFLFVPPLYTFQVSDLRYVLTFFMMLLTALVISGFTLRIREQGETARDRERRTAALYALSRDLADTRSRADIVRTARRHLGETFHFAMQVLVPGNDSRLEVLAPAAPDLPVDEKERGVADWVFRRGEIAGQGTATLPGAAALHLPLSGAGGVVGVLVVAAPDLERFQLPAQRHLLETFAGLVAVALERVTLAERTQQAQLQVEAERLRTSLLSSLSHDLRTPLGVITGAASSLRERGDQLSTDARVGLLDSIIEESERMNRLIRNLLDMIRVETGSLEVQKEWQPLEDTIGVALLRLDERMKDHPVEVRLPPDLPLVPLDAVLLEQVFINLLENAARHTPPGTRVEITAQQTSSGVEVTVADRGPGLPVGEEDQIFEKFYRGASAEPGKGVGLGLTICRGIITAHGGRIWAESRPGGGALIHFTLPLTGPAPPPIPEEAEAAPA